MIEVDETEGVALLRMASGKANAMSLEFCELLTARFEELKRSDAPAVVITGSGRIFSAGADLLKLVDGGSSYVGKFLPALSTMLAAVFSHPKPVVAAINGHAIAGGCVLACAADRRLMARAAGRIGVTVLVGVPFPCSAIEIMRCVLSARHFSEVIFTGTTYSPTEAAERDLIHEVAEPDALLARAIGCARTLAGLPAQAFALTKQQIREPSLARLRADASKREVEEIWSSPETLHRVRDYVARTLKKA